MQVEQSTWTAGRGWSPRPVGQLGERAQLALIFAAPEILIQPGLLADVRAAYPNAHLLGCSTAGEISGTAVADDSLTVTAVAFEHSRVVGTRVEVSDPAQSFAAGVQLIGQLPLEDLVHVFVLSDGLGVNGSELVRGITSRLPSHITATGGLSGDGSRFAATYVVGDDAPRSNVVAAVGLYGSRLHVGYGSLGGWDSFGPERLVTKSRGNVLYELDGRPVLDLYRMYLGELADGLPATGLLYPLSVRLSDCQHPVVRTILGIDEAAKSMTFAGDIPEGTYARLMKANFDRLIDGAAGAAQTTRVGLADMPADLAVLISCVGRKMVLKQRVDEEVEGVREVLGTRPVLTGFYSYGEIAPFSPHARCELHNQTMTITTFCET